MGYYIDTTTGEELVKFDWEQMAWPVDLATTSTLFLTLLAGVRRREVGREEFTRRARVLTNFVTEVLMS